MSELNIRVWPNCVDFFREKFQVLKKIQVKFKKNKQNIRTNWLIGYKKFFCKTH